MRRYETIFITEPDFPDEEVTGLVDGLNAAITEGRGEPLKTEDWGRKKLAYPVRKYTEGRYLRLEYESADGTLTDEVERRLRMAEPVLKFMTIRIDNDKKRLVWEAKQAVKEKERAARRAAEEEATAAAEAAKAAEAPETTEDAGSDESPPAATQSAGGAATDEQPSTEIRPDAGQEG
ncbi:MAG: 30S ribosomal protein S6 [Acidobacteria bacterium]|nr:MAG: 30S ribosomal protein S6 [Acidobacteriota bacterium]TDI47353.1 MAG: 30S ribosomal protein S6 [Acidobacteriota bacterium]